jgi:hypothetical protein
VRYCIKISRVSFIVRSQGFPAFQSFQGFLGGLPGPPRASLQPPRLPGPPQRLPRASQGAFRSSQRFFQNRPKVRLTFAVTVSHSSQSEKPQRYQALRFSRACDRLPRRYHLPMRRVYQIRRTACKFARQTLPGLSFMDLISTRQPVSRLGLLARRRQSGL